MSCNVGVWQLGNINCVESHCSDFSTTMAARYVSPLSRITAPLLQKLYCSYIETVGFSRAIINVGNYVVYVFSLDIIEPVICRYLYIRITYCFSFILRHKYIVVFLCNIYVRVFRLVFVESLGAKIKT